MCTRTGLQGLRIHNGVAACWVLAGIVAQAAHAEELRVVEDVEVQPLVSATRRLLEALAFIGAPLPAGDLAELRGILESATTPESATALQRVLDRHCLVGVDINPESRVKVAEGPAKKELVQHGWRRFLVKVHNGAGVTPRLFAESPHAAPLYTPSEGSPDPAVSVTPGEVVQRFLDLDWFDRAPLKEALSGLPLEYKILQIYSRDAGRREALLQFHVGQGTQDLGFRSEVAVLFDCLPAVRVELEVLDFDGKPTTASFVIRDSLDRVYPAPSRRLAPDFFFHAQIYRKSGEDVLLPPGQFKIECTRGPEYFTSSRSINVTEEPRKESFQLERWIHPAALGWKSGDHHVHAAGCAHYESPSQGVTPADMMRHLVGENLDVGCVLSWGPCWYFQKQYFEGAVNAASTPQNLMRYDVEVSGFPSSHAGHLTLLRLTEDDYPGAANIEQWPSWDLPILQWGKRQGAVVGFSHSGFGLQYPGSELPSLVVPPFDGIGANEYIVDVTHDAVDFISTVDTPATWELNIWYHTLNVGFRTRISGETDFPCIYGDRVGMGRVYVKCPDGPLVYDTWVNGLRDGRSYVSDGMSHLIGFRVDDLCVGEPGAGGVLSQIDLGKPGEVMVKAEVAAMLSEARDPEIRERPLDEKPFWNLERARIGDSRRVPLEVVVDGVAVARQEFLADGELRPVQFTVPIEHSSWVALRIFPSSHTNPVFVEVAGKPVRASRQSAEWCLAAVDACWNQKQPNIAIAERPAAEQAYQHARRIYRQRLAECERR